MSIPVLVLILLLLITISFYLGRKRALVVSNGNVRRLNSLPSYYGCYMALWCGMPVLLILAFWHIVEPTIITQLVISGLPEQTASLSKQQLNLVLNEIHNLVNENIAAENIAPEIVAAADYYREMQQISRTALFALTIALGLFGTTYAWSRIHEQHRARNKVEKAILVFLIVCSSIAIFTTLGIVLSVLFEGRGL